MGFISLLTYIYYALYFPHVISVSISYNKSLLIFFLFSLHYSLKDILLIPHSHLFVNGMLLTVLSQFPTFYSTPLLTLLQTVDFYPILHSLVTHTTSTHYLWTTLLILLPTFLLLLSQNVSFLTTYYKLPRLYSFLLQMVIWLWSQLSNKSMVSLMPHSTSTSLLVLQSYSLFSNTCHSYLHIFLYLLSLPATNNFLLLAPLSFIFLYVLLLVHYNVAR